MTKMRLDQKLEQKVSAQQIQLVSLLQTNQLALQERIFKELAENPALDEVSTEEEVTSLEELEELWEEGRSKVKKPKGMSAEEIAEFHSVDKRSFQEQLKQQVDLLTLSDVQKKMALQLIAHLDEKGYLPQRLSIIREELAIHEGVDIPLKEWEILLSMLQRAWHPSGVGARNPQESLLLQVESKPDSPVRTLAKELLQHHFKALAMRQHEKLLSAYSKQKELLKRAMLLIQSLRPEPIASSKLHSEENSSLKPDFIVYKEDDVWRVKLARQHHFQLKIRKNYQKLLETHRRAKDEKSQEVVAFIEKNIQRAKWFMDALRQRDATLLAMMEGILSIQYRFFEHQEEQYLEPIYLRHIAEYLHMDISTVSRAVAGRAVQTPQGVYPLKYFFSEPIETKEGKKVSSRVVKQVLTTLIKEEDKRHPYTDEALTRELNKLGYMIARRTVAKYRTQLGIPVGKMRCSFWH